MRSTAILQDRFEELERELAEAVAILSAIFPGEDKFHFTDSIGNRAKAFVRKHKGVGNG